MRVLERYRQICLHPVFYLPALPLNADGYGSTEHKCKRVGKNKYKLIVSPISCKAFLLIWQFHEITVN